MASEEQAKSSESRVLVQPLGKNKGRYLGDTIEIQAVLREAQTLGLKHGWRNDCFLQDPQLCLTAFHRAVKAASKRLYISTGIHGDEPAGPLAAVELLRQNHWPPDLDVWLCPCLNPTGFPLNTRENANGLDLNRQYLDTQAPEVRAHKKWLEQQPTFDVTLCLHEDWEAHGFYVYELSLDPAFSYAEDIVHRVSRVCPIDLSPMIEGREAHGGIIRPTADPTSRPQWPEAFFLISQKTRVSCTLEAPSDFPVEVRVEALVEGVRAVLDRLSGSGGDTLAMS